jgi:RNA polymerase sigma-70 factor (ECF subfamily)
MEKEFLKAIQDYQKIIYKVCALYRDRREDQEDLFQEIVYQLWKSYPGFRGESKKWEHSFEYLPFF